MITYQLLNDISLPPFVDSTLSNSFQMIKLAGTVIPHSKSIISSINYSNHNDSWSEDFAQLRNGVQLLPRMCRSDLFMLHEWVRKDEIAKNRRWSNFQLLRCCAAITCGFQMVCMFICGPIIALLIIGLIVYFLFLRDSVWLNK